MPSCNEFESSNFSDEALCKWQKTVANCLSDTTKGYVNAGAVENTNSGLRFLTVRTVRHDVGMRILYSYIVKENFNAGCRFGRWPNLFQMHALTLIKLILLTAGMIPETSQTAFARQLLVDIRVWMPEDDDDKLVAEDAKVFLGSEWQCYNSLANPPINLTNDPTANSTNTPTTTSNPTANSTNNPISNPPSNVVLNGSQNLIQVPPPLTIAQFMDFLGIHSTDITRNTMSAEERRLLIKVMTLQETVDREGDADIKNCPLVLTILYNASVHALGEAAVNLKIG
ncbi:hypothetical protein DFS34DRAFT_590379 [Phlyctochytrium arcticum]|nr:hypothetical protein DFS34DRAFT_590379 [Phlyctochytrium arcticum]